MKIINISKGVVFVLLLILFQQLNAQNERSLFFLPGIPQEKYMNPAAFPENKFYIGIPILSSMKVGLENTFTYEDFFTPVGDSIYFDRDHFIDNLNPETSLNMDMLVEYFSAGFRLNDNYFTFRIADNGNVNATFTKETLLFFLYGNGSDQYLGKEVNLGGNGINFSFFREYALGYSRKINPKLTVGMNMKYLQGIANVSTNDLSVSLFTDSVDYTIKLKSNIEINTSLPGENGGIESADFMPSSDNPGFAFDFGAEYQFNEKLSAALGVTNIGFINWNANPKNYRSSHPDEEFVYEGFELEEYFEDNAFNSGALNNALDSIADEIGVVETAEGYRTAVPSWLNINANYRFTPSHQAGILFQNRFLQNQNWSTLTLAYTYSLKDKLHAMVSNTFSRSSAIAPSFGVGTNLGPMQIFIINENFVAPFSYRKATFYSLHLTINLVFRDKVKLAPEETTTPALEN